MANYPVEWGWQADLEPDAGNQPRVIPLLPSILGGADPDVIQAAARMARSAPLSGPPTSGPSGERDERLGYLDGPANGGGRNGSINAEH